MVFAFLLMAQLSAGDITYQEARALVGKHESTLSTEQGDLLYAAQELAMTDAVPKCMEKVSPGESLRVALVLSIGESGQPTDYWVKEDNSFANCMKEELMVRSYISPPKLPFFTNFDLDVNITRKP